MGQERLAHAQYKLHAKTGQKIRSAAAEMFQNRTSTPHFLEDPNMYPARAPGDELLYREINAAKYRFHRPQSTSNKSIRGNMAHIGDYSSKADAVAMLSKARVVEAFLISRSSSTVTTDQQAMWSQDPENLLSYVWGSKWIGLRGRTLAPREHLGRELHSWSEDEAALLLIAVALYGNRLGMQGWRHFNLVLVQGGWPWLVGYTKAYAKSVWIVLISFFSAVEEGAMAEDVGVGHLMLNLAKTLVRRVGGGPTGVKLRLNDRLVGPKTKIYGTTMTSNAGSAGKEVIDDGGLDLERLKNQDASKSTSSLRLKSQSSISTLAKGTGQTTDGQKIQKTSKTTDNIQGWKLSNSAELDILKVSLFSSQKPDFATYIISGQACTHSENTPFSGHVGAAHSLKELESQVHQQLKLQAAELARTEKRTGKEEKAGITVAQTLGEKDARDEAIGYAVEAKWMTVVRAPKQCVACAYLTAHCVGALVLVV